MSDKKRILTGLKPTGELTLGNYIGSLSQMIKLQDEYDSYLFVADLHALTIPQNPKELHERIRRFIAMYIACGIDPKKNTIYIQSENEYIPAMSYLLECATYYGEASRMIQFKEKSKQNANFTLGLLTYPVLMAVDILYCDADYVPVGIDQKQHVELARDIAERFNKHYGETFILPEPVVSEQGIKIKDLKDPCKKMSKSEENPQGVISMFDDPEDIKKKIMKATTDSDNEVRFDEENKPGISNLLNIASALTGKSVEEIEKEFIGKGYGDFKRYVADVTAEHISKIQERYNELINSKELEEILDEGRDKTRELAKVKFELIKERMGVIR
ncbi:MAG: tryptophan--tRNA ligase [Clostridia bacterium]|nr:tryptophan--tRNA ligase [Clostridia bacterium]